MKIKKEIALDVLKHAKNAAVSYQWHLPSVYSYLKDMGYANPKYALARATEHQLEEAEQWIAANSPPESIGDEIRRLVDQCAFSAADAADAAVEDHNRLVREKKGLNKVWAENSPDKSDEQYSAWK